MTVNITMLVRNRPQLTKQAITTMFDNTREELNFTVVDDASDRETQMLLEETLEAKGRPSLVVRNDRSSGTGLARTQVIRESEKHFGRGEYLYLSDNDVAFHPQWLETLIEAYKLVHWYGFRVVGAYNHPYNPPFRQINYYSRLHGSNLAVGECHAVAMQSWLMEWETWDKFGEFSATPVDKVRQSEDHEWCQRLRSAGFRVGVLVPPRLTNTGRTDTFGEPVPGHNLIPDEAGVVVL